MAHYYRTRAILPGAPTRVFNHGNLERDFTFIDDIAWGISAVAKAQPDEKYVPYRLLKLGNNAPVALGYFIAALEH